MSVLGRCILPCFFIIGSVSAVSENAMQIKGTFLWLEGSTAESYSYQTTETDEYGNSQPTTAYELHGVGSNGEVVKTIPLCMHFFGIVSLYSSV